MFGFMVLFFRCYYIGQSLSTLHRWRDTMAMYERALLHTSSAIDQVDDDLKTRLSNLVNSIESSKYCAHAQSVLEQDDEEELDSLKNSKLQKVVFLDFDTFLVQHPFYWYVKY